MANPRKFSEKIALHNQKQAEETAAFEEIMREVMGATRTPTPYNSNQLHIAPTFSAANRAGSLPNVNQIGQNNSGVDNNNAAIDLQSCLNNLEEIKNGCLERSGSVRVESSSRRNFSNSTHQKRSQSPYSTNNAYLSPPPPDGHWRRTNSDSALHQSALLSATTTHQTLEGFNQLITNNAFNGASNGSPRRSAALLIDNSGNLATLSPCTDSNGSAVEWESTKNGINSSATDKFLLSASLPDQHLRPRSCEVPGINIYPSQDDNNSEMANHHIPISSNTGSLPDLTNLHFPVPLHAIDGDEQSGANVMQANMMVSGGPNSPYSNGPDSPFSPGSSHNSNLSPPPPCNMMGNYSTSPTNQSPRRQTSPGPSPSPTAARRRIHHNVNNLVIGTGLRHQPQQQQQQPHQAQSQVCFPPQHHTPQHTPPHIPPRVPSYLNETNPQQYNRFKSPPRITVEGLALDTSALSLNNGTGNGVQYKQMNVNNQNSNSDVLLSNASCGSPFQQQQFHFTNSQSFQNFSMGMHRSTTPTDSCSAPTSPASQNISPSNSPELPINTNGGNVNISNQQFNNYAYSNQANILQHQLEQFRMTSDSDTTTYMMSCNSELASPLQSSGANQNAFYLDSLNTANVSLSQYTDHVISQPNSNEMPSSPHQISSHNVAFSNESLYFTTSQLSQMGNISGNGTQNMYKTEIPTNMNMNNMYNNQHQQLSNSSHCTTPQTPSSIPDIILTGPNNLDELQSTNDFVKDLNNSMVNINTSFDSDIFCSASDDLRTGTFDSFDLDNLPILPDIDSNTE